VVASNRNLRDAAQQGVFREDLYYRLNVIQLWIPALRERREDIPLLCKHFIDRYNHEFGRQVQGVEPEADQALREYDWPGNIRELRNVIERALILGSESLIGLDHLPSEITSRRTRDTAHAVFNIQIPDEGISLEEVEKSLVRAALKQTGGNQSRAARMLSISRDALRYKMQRFGLFSTHRQQTDD
jgi:two-component system response regulator AtoC